MNIPRSKSVLFRGACCATTLFALQTSLLAQTTSSTGQTGEDEDEIVVLSPFEVSGERDSGYQVGDTLAGSRLRMKLSDVGAAVSVVNEQFMLDTGSTSVEDILIYTPGTETGGVGGNFSGVSLGSGGFSDAGEYLLEPQRSTRVRGLNGADLTRDFFPTDIPMDAYNTSRVDISRGANSILFGLGSPAGIINNQLRTPNMAKDGYSLTHEYARFDSHRVVVDLNKAIPEANLAIRVIGLLDHENFQQKPAYENDERLFASLSWEPHLVRNGFTQLSFHYEDGEIDANRPRPTPPIDGVTAWFDVLNKLELDPARTSEINTNPFLFAHLDAAGRSFSQPTAVFTDPASGAQGGAGTPEIMQTRGGDPYTQWWAVAGYAAKSGLPNHFLNQLYAPAGEAFGGLWRNQEIMDPSIFNFYDILLDGPNKREGRDFSALNATARQTFLQDAFGFEVSYDRQSYNAEQFYNALSYTENWIRVDMQTKLVDGSPNPNFGRPFVASDSGGNSFREKEREFTRATVFADLDFSEKDGLLRHLGRHVFTGSYGKQTAETFDRYYNGYGYTLDTNRYGSDPVQGASFPGYQTWAGIHYLGPSIAGLSRAPGANIGGIVADQTPAKTATGLIYNSLIGSWDRVPLTIIDSNSDLDKLYTNANKSSDETESFAAVWQTYLFSDHVVGLLGWREDEFSLYDAGGPPNIPVTGQTDPFDPNWTLPETPNIYAKDSAVSWSVVAHSPDFINRLFPAGTRFSLAYSESENFRPSAVVTNVYGQQFDPPSGLTEDTSFSVSLADGKFLAKVTKYRTTQSNDQATFYPVFWAGNDVVRAMNGLKNGAFNSEVVVNRWFGFEPGDSNYLPLRSGLSDPAQANVPNPSRTAAEQAFAQQWFAARTPEEWLRPVDPLLAEGWQFTQNPGNGNWSATMPPNSGNVADIVSEGWEFEVTYNPTRNWRMIFNAAKTEAVRSNVGADLTAFVEANRSLFEDGDGHLATSVREQEGLEDILHFNGFGPNSLGGRYQTEILIPYLNALASNGSTVQELREWRFNFITTYDFREGILNGFTVGGAARWQDEGAIGYTPTQNQAGVWINDITKPIYATDQLDFDFWLGYQRKILNDRATWRIQLNVRDAFGGNELIAVAAQPNGQTASARIATPQRWSISNTFTF
ncbi:TonB-dependent receptor plug domain-containing protein [Synoicihabitans lomoniglobus]|uniref:TonB-dependent receptor plug domain-containing protein n=1 Tax=Synoicihabitans lomoniglobus TaxID=2909285 RepID=A0AAE9ZWZ6_9BACT|nr:TonB-dependent receptor plug domain-containing protein [Opitutaceae bacterium LMO-M01]WED64058.1 TonB-dependent receptor plug domain-containing protein [Opitutaceae bacterium LMO-M01]